MGKFFTVFNISAELYKIGTDGMPNFNGLIDGSVDTGVAGSVEGNVQLQFYAELFR